MTQERPDKDATTPDTDLQRALKELSEWYRFRLSGFSELQQFIGNALQSASFTELKKVGTEEKYLSKRAMISLKRDYNMQLRTLYYLNLRRKQLEKQLPTAKAEGAVAKTTTSDVAKNSQEQNVEESSDTPASGHDDTPKSA